MEPLVFNKKHSIIYGEKTICFTLLFSDRKTMEISVHPDKSIIVKVPKQSDITIIEEKITKKARWVLKQLNYFKQFNPKTPPRSYVNGETHLYLGRQYRLKFLKGDKNSVKLSHGFFHITCRNEPTPNAAKKLLNQWYSEKAQLQFTKSLVHCWQNFKHLEIEKPKLSIKQMQKRWGSLSSRGTITLNTNLIKAPKECIDYVVTHELCHLKHHNHSPDFYNLLSSIMPDWEKRKQKLELKMH